MNKNKTNPGVRELRSSNPSVAKHVPSDPSMIILSYFQTLPLTMTSSHFTSLDLGLLIYKMLMFKNATIKTLAFLAFV